MLRGVPINYDSDSPVLASEDTSSSNQPTPVVALGLTQPQLKTTPTLKAPTLTMPGMAGPGPGPNEMYSVTLNSQQPINNLLSNQQYPLGKFQFGAGGPGGQAQSDTSDVTSGSINNNVNDQSIQSMNATFGNNNNMNLNYSNNNITNVHDRTTFLDYETSGNSVPSNVMEHRNSTATILNNGDIGASNEYNQYHKSQSSSATRFFPNIGYTGHGYHGGNKSSVSPTAAAVNVTQIMDTSWNIEKQTFLFHNEGEESDDTNNLNRVMNSVASAGPNYNNNNKMNESSITVVREPTNMNITADFSFYDESNLMNQNDLSNNGPESDQSLDTPDIKNPINENGTITSQEAAQKIPVQEPTSYASSGGPGQGETGPITASQNLQSTANQMSMSQSLNLNKSQTHSQTIAPHEQLNQPEDHRDTQQVFNEDFILKPRGHGPSELEAAANEGLNSENFDENLILHGKNSSRNPKAGTDLVEILRNDGTGGKTLLNKNSLREIKEVMTESANIIRHAHSTYSPAIPPQSSAQIAAATSSSSNKMVNVSLDMSSNNDASENNLNLNPHQWAEKLAEQTDGDWWVDSVILGRLARLAVTFYELRCVHKPYLSWWSYVLYRRKKAQMAEKNMKSITLRSWKFKMNYRNPVKKKMYIGLMKIQGLLTSKIRFGWKSLSMPIFLGRQAKRSQAICSLLRNRMLTELARCFRRQRLLRYWLVIWNFARTLTKGGGKSGKSSPSSSPTNSNKDRSSRKSKKSTNINKALTDQDDDDFDLTQGVTELDFSVPNNLVDGELDDILHADLEGEVKAVVKGLVKDKKRDASPDNKKGITYVGRFHTGQKNISLRIEPNHIENELLLAKSRPFLKLVKKKAWMRWQRAIQFWLSPAEFDIYHHSSYIAGNVNHPPIPRSLPGFGIRGAGLDGLDDDDDDADLTDQKRIQNQAISERVRESEELDMIMGIKGHGVGTTSGANSTYKQHKLRGSNTSPLLNRETDIINNNTAGPQLSSWGPAKRRQRLLFGSHILEELEETEKLHQAEDRVNQGLNLDSYYKQILGSVKDWIPFPNVTSENNTSDTYYGSGTDNVRDYDYQPGNRYSATQTRRSKSPTDGTSPSKHMTFKWKGRPDDWELMQEAKDPDRLVKMMPPQPGKWSKTLKKLAWRGGATSLLNMDQQQQISQELTMSSNNYLSDSDGPNNMASRLHITKSEVQTHLATDVLYHELKKKGIANPYQYFLQAGEGQSKVISLGTVADAVQDPSRVPISGEGDDGGLNINRPSEIESGRGDVTSNAKDNLSNLNLNNLTAIINQTKQVSAGRSKSGRVSPRTAAILARMEGLARINAPLSYQERQEIIKWREEHPDDSESEFQTLKETPDASEINSVSMNQHSKHSLMFDHDDDPNALGSPGVGTGANIEDKLGNNRTSLMKLLHNNEQYSYGFKKNNQKDNQQKAQGQTKQEGEEDLDNTDGPGAEIYDTRSSLSPGLRSPREPLKLGKMEESAYIRLKKAVTGSKKIEVKGVSLLKTVEEEE